MEKPASQNSREIKKLSIKAAEQLAALRISLFTNLKKKRPGVHFRRQPGNFFPYAIFSSAQDTAEEKSNISEWKDGAVRWAPIQPETSTLFLDGFASEMGNQEWNSIIPQNLQFPSVQ